MQDQKKIRRETFGNYGLLKRDLSCFLNAIKTVYLYSVICF